MKHLLDEQREDGDIDRDQIGEGDGEQAADRKHRLNGGDGEASRDENDDEERALDAGGGDGDEEEEGERNRQSHYVRHYVPLLGHDRPRKPRALSLAWATGA